MKDGFYQTLNSMLFFVWLVLSMLLCRAVFISPKVAHIYLDPASTPALFQMIDLLHQLPEEPKFVAWRRYTHALPTKLLSSHHITRSEITADTSDYSFQQITKREIKLFYQKYPRAIFVIHGNMYHPWSFESALSVIPKEQIKKLHLYEDSVGRVLWEGCTSILTHYAPKWPTVYHMAFLKQAKSMCPEVTSLTLEETEWMRLKKGLGKSLKTVLYYLTGLEEKTVRALYGKGEVIVFLDDTAVRPDKLRMWLKEKLDEYPELKNAVWLYKNHPRFRGRGPSWGVLKSMGLKVHPLPSKMPFEVLILADLMPRYVMGYSSSVFFSVPPERVLGYIRRQHDPYLPILKKLYFFPDKAVLSME